LIEIAEGEEDNEGQTPEQFLQYALEDVDSMGDDFGGAFQMGIAPRYVKADGSPDTRAQQLADAALADVRRQHKVWRADRNQAIKLLDQLQTVE